MNSELRSGSVTFSTVEIDPTLPQNKEELCFTEMFSLPRKKHEKRGGEIAERWRKGVEK
jgi:hypothetical protein